MHIAECAQCGKRSAFIIDVEDVLADSQDEFLRELQGTATVMIINGHKLYCGITLTNSATARLAQKFEHERLTAELYEGIAKHLKSLEVAICPKCYDTCDVLINFASTTMKLHITKL